MNHNRRLRFLTALLMSIALCLALGSAQAEVSCTHVEMDFMPNAASDTLTASCAACGYHAQLHMPPLVVEEGSAYSYAPVMSGKDEWDIPYKLIYVSNKVHGLAQLPIIDPPTTAGTYYVVPELPWNGYPRIWGQLVITGSGHTHHYHYQSSGNVITAVCSDCGVNSSLTLNINSARIGMAAKAAVLVSGNWPGESCSVLYYDSADNQLTELPQDPGAYCAKITANGCTAVQPFTIYDGNLELKNIPAGRIINPAPYGLAFTRTEIHDGQYHVTVSRENTNWGDVISQLYDAERDMTIWQTPHIGVHPDATGFEARIFTGKELAADPHIIQKKVDELYAKSAVDNINSSRPRTLGMFNIGGYSPENGLFEPYMDSDRYYYVLGWYQHGTLIALEQLSIMVDIDNKSSFVITADSLPSANILPATNLSAGDVKIIDYSAGAGSVAYHAEDRNALNYSSIETTVLLPDPIADKAAYCEIRYDAFEDPIEESVQTVNGKPAIVISSGIPDNNSAEEYSYALTFYDKDYEYIKAYSLRVTIRMGEPVPFPMYHDDWKAIPDDRVQLHITNTNGKHVPNGLGLSYDSKLGIANYEIDSNKLPRGQSLNGILGTIHITPPKGATAYRMYPQAEGGLSIRPDMYNADNDDSRHAEARIANSPMIEMENGLFSRSIEYPFLQGRRISLIPNHTYTLYQLGLPSMGELGAGFRLIYWYENADDPKPMLKEYLLVTHDPACTPTWSTPATIKEDLSSISGKQPRIVISCLDDKRTEYRFYAGIMPQTVNQELHYELYLTDQSGKEISKDTIAALAPFTIFIPVPEGIDATDPRLSFTVSHLNEEGTQITESFSYEKGTLALTEFGLSFTVNNFSPFVLSWGPAEADVSLLPQTGDNSPALPMLLMALSISLGLIALSLRKRHA